MNEPIRLSESNQLPHALRAAFGAMGRVAPSMETVLRVQHVLQAMPVAVPNVAAASGLSLAKLFVIATLITGGVSTPLVWKSRPWASIERSPWSAPVQEPVVPPSVPAPAPVIAAPAPVVRASVEDNAHVAQHRSRQGTLKRRAAHAAALATVVEAAEPAEVSVTEPDHALVADALPSAPAPASVNAAADEAQQLARCKQLATRDPERALRELDMLARTHPHGAFLQERDLLEIRLRARLGDGAAAAALSQRFLQRYPNSVYRRALAP